MDQPAVQPDSSPYEHKRFSWEGADTGSQQFTIVNTFGDVRVRTSERGFIAVTAQIQTFGSEKFDVLVNADNSTPGVVVKSYNNAMPQGRVDVTVLLPPGKSLSVSTVDGRNEAKYRGDIVAETQSGAIFIKTSGDVMATSIRGKVDLAIPAADSARTVTVSTAGDVQAWLTPQSNLSLQLNAADGVSIAMSGLLEKQDEQNEHYVLGDGGDEVSLTSTGGKILILPLPPG
ncbi:MAG: hypothetical protein KJO35_01155 [Gammaproteobacteria bacterium]|nr:hypothetical protein [Gammaproteobacteria bacterium]